MLMIIYVYTSPYIVRIVFINFLKIIEDSDFTELTSKFDNSLRILIIYKNFIYFISIIIIIR